MPLTLPIIKLKTLLDKHYAGLFTSRAIYEFLSLEMETLKNTLREVLFKCSKLSQKY